MDSPVDLRVAKPCVVFFDCCIPQRQFNDIFPAVVISADFVFVRDRLDPKICNNDRNLFTEVNRLREREFPGRACVFVTQDGRDFRKKIRGHPAGKNILVVVIKSFQGRVFAIIRAGQVAVGVARAIDEARWTSHGGEMRVGEIFSIFKKHLSAVSI